jgi:DNA-binding MarR family transcriptional regulator
LLECRALVATLEQARSVRQYKRILAQPCPLHYEAISAADLARLTMLTPQTINGIVRALEIRGAIRREPDRVNGRILRLIVTEEGRELNKRCRALAAPIEAALNAKMSANAREAVRHWLVDVAEAFLN